VGDDVLKFVANYLTACIRETDYVFRWGCDECLIVFLRKGDAVNAASMHTTGREVITITEALRRMRAEVERGDLAYSTAPMVQLAWMYQSCAVDLQPRTLDPKEPQAFFPSLRQEQVTGVIELISDGRVSYLRFDGGRFAEGYFCDKPDQMQAAPYLESQMRAHTLSAVMFPPVSDLPAQAPTSLINTYRELYWRIADEVEKEPLSDPPGPEGVPESWNAQGACAAQLAARHGAARNGGSA
jgi:hypothetical protein